MGLHFGNLMRIKGITYYAISPHEQKALKGILNPGLKNVARRTRESFFLFGIPAFITYLVYKMSIDYHHKLHRKNPKDYENDV